MTPYYEDPWLTVYHGDARAVMSEMEPESVHCVVTSPPYWQLRDYGEPTQLGLEPTPGEYVEALRTTFQEVRRVLTAAGSLWLNLGDTYAASGKGGGGSRGNRKNWRTIVGRSGWRTPPPGWKKKDITLTPFLVADALRRDGWYLRSVIVWSKPQSPEPPRLDRPSTSHEYVFLLAKSEDYAARNPSAPWWHQSVWHFPSDSDASHQAVMPSELARRCILAGTVAGDVVLDPFAGSGVVGSVAQSLSRRAVLIDLSMDYLGQLMDRNRDIPLGLESA